MLLQPLRQNLRCISSIGMVFMAATLLILFTGSAGAAALPISAPVTSPCGTAGAGCLNATLSVQVLANSCINFFAFPPNNTPDAPCASPDSFLEGSPSDSTIFTPGGAAVTKDLAFGGGVVTGFLTAAGPLGTVTFDLESVILSGQPTCPATPSGIITCSIGLFTLSQQDLNSTSCPTGISNCGQVSVAFAFNAEAYLGGTTSNGFTNYVMNYTSQFNNETVGDLINKAATGSGATGGIFNSVSLTANPTNVPEPAEFVLIGAGLIGIGLLARRRRFRA